jgi:hypothetical protein
MTNETKAPVTISRNELENALLRRMVLSWKNGGGRWHYVRVWPDGSITDGIEVSETLPESEYFHRGNPHPVTVWSETSNFTAGPQDGIFEWLECAEEDAEFWAERTETTVNGSAFTGLDNASDERDETHTVPYRLDYDSLVEPIDLTAILSEIEDQLTEVGYSLEN